MGRRLRTLLVLAVATGAWAGLAAWRAAERARREDALWAAATDHLTGGSTERRSVHV